MTKWRKKKDTPELIEFWAFIERTAKDMESFPDWKRGGTKEIIYTPKKRKLTPMEKWLLKED